MDGIGCKCYRIVLRAFGNIVATDAGSPQTWIRIEDCHLFHIVYVIDSGSSRQRRVVAIKSPGEMLLAERIDQHDIQIVHQGWSREQRWRGIVPGHHGAEFVGTALNRQIVVEHL